MRYREAVLVTGTSPFGISSETTHVSPYPGTETSLDRNDNRWASARRRRWRRDYPLLPTSRIIGGAGTPCWARQPWLHQAVWERRRGAPTLRTFGQGRRFLARRSGGSASAQQQARPCGGAGAGGASHRATGYSADRYGSRACLAGETGGRLRSRGCRTLPHPLGF